MESRKLKLPREFDRTGVKSRKQFPHRAGDIPARAEKRHRRLFISIGIVIAALLLLRLIAPLIMLRYLNSKIDTIGGYHGEISDLHLKVIRGAFELDRVRFTKFKANKEYPFLAVKTVYLSVYWMPLFRGSISSRVIVDEPKINFFVSKAPSEPSQTSVEREWRDQITQILPIRVNTFEVRNGEFLFQDFTKNPPLQFEIHRIHLTAHNLTNREKDYHNGLATLGSTAELPGDGNLKLEAIFDPLIKPPKFELQSEVKIKNLAAWNSVFQSFAKVDVKGGQFEVISELSTADGKFRGYLKPFVKDVRILNLKKDSHRGLGRLIWQSLVALGAAVLENPEDKKIAAKVPFVGSIKDPKADLAETIVTLLENGFVRAISPVFDRKPVIRLNTRQQLSH